MPMQISIFDDMTQCTEQEVARLLDVVSVQRREQAMAYKHLFGQFCCLKSYEMLIGILVSRFSPNSLSPHLPTFLYNEYGQPRLEHGPYFSISHCKHGIAVAVSEMPIGVDIEHIRTAKPELVARTMNEEEQTEILTAVSPDIAFTRLWTQKEAVLKMRGTGIIDDIKNTLVALDNIDLRTKVDIEKQYVVSICLENAPNGATV